MGGCMVSLLVDELGVDVLVCFGYLFYVVGKLEKLWVVYFVGLCMLILIVQGECDVLGNCEVVVGYVLVLMICLYWLVVVDYDFKLLKVFGLIYEQYLVVMVWEVVGFFCGFQGY